VSVAKSAPPPPPRCRRRPASISTARRCRTTGAHIAHAHGEPQRYTFDTCAVCALPTSTVTVAPRADQHRPDDRETVSDRCTRLSVNRSERASWRFWCEWGVHRSPVLPRGSPSALRWATARHLGSPSEESHLQTLPEVPLSRADAPRAAPKEREASGCAGRTGAGAPFRPPPSSGSLAGGGASWISGWRLPLPMGGCPPCPPLSWLPRWSGTVRQAQLFGQPIG